MLILVWTREIKMFKNILILRFDSNVYMDKNVRNNSQF